MRLFAIGDLHMPGPLGKTMDVFGDQWIDHLDRIAADWDRRVGDEDVVLVPGDVSWALRLRDVETDLAWLGARPGTTILIRGNHDYWWQSIGKVRNALPPRCHAIQNDAWCSEDGRLAVAGSRLWDVPDLLLGDIFEPGTSRAEDAGDAGDSAGSASGDDGANDVRIFRRELSRLEASLSAIPARAERRVVMTHFPPTSPSFEATPVTELLDAHRVDVCVFGHLHGVRAGVTFDGRLHGVRYVLASADHLDFRLLEIPLDVTPPAP